MESDNAKSCHGRPLVELLAMRANLGAIGEEIAVLDGTRGLILYKKGQQQGDDSEEGKMVDLVLVGPSTRISAKFGWFTIRIDTPCGVPIQWTWDDDEDEYADQVDAVEPSCKVIKTPDGCSKVAEVTYAVMSDALVATVEVLLQLEDGFNLGDTNGSKITALIEGFPEDKSSVLFWGTQRMDQRLSRPSDGDDSCFCLQLDRNIVAVPRGKVLYIKVDLPNTSAYLSFKNGIRSRTYQGVKVNINWYPEVAEVEETCEMCGGPGAISPRVPSWRAFQTMDNMLLGSCADQMHMVAYWMERLGENKCSSCNLAVMRTLRNKSQELLGRAKRIANRDHCESSW